jgi:hypothetical protein
MFDLPISSLGAWPIVQFAVAIVLLLGGLAAIRQGTRDKRGDAAPEPADTMPRFYFDGPMAAALKSLAAIEGLLRRIGEGLETIARQQKDLAQRFDDQRQQSGRFLDPLAEQVGLLKGIKNALDEIVRVKRRTR